MADHEKRRAVAAAKVAAYEATVATSIVGALDEQRRKTEGYFHKGTPPPDPFDLATWDDNLQKNVQPTVNNVLTDVIKDVLLGAGIGYSLSKVLGTPGAGGVTLASALNNSAGEIVKRASNIGSTVGRNLTTGLASAASEEEAEANVTKIFTVADSSAGYLSRAVNLFANMLSVQAAQTVHPEQAMQKTWTAIDDSVTRPDHSEADGQTVPVDQPFIVGGFEGMYPGDANLPDEEVINCRCWVVIEPQGT